MLHNILIYRSSIGNEGSNKSISGHMEDQGSSHLLLDWEKSKYFIFLSVKPDVHRWQCCKLRRWDLYTCNPCVSSKVVSKGLNRSIRAIVIKWGIVRLHSDKEIPSNNDISSVENHAITIDHRHTIVISQSCHLQPYSKGWNTFYFW